MYKKVKITLGIVTIFVLCCIAIFSARSIKETEVSQIIIDSTEEIPHKYNAKAEKTMLTFSENTVVKDFFAESDDRYIYLSEKRNNSYESDLNLYDNGIMDTICSFSDEEKISDIALTKDKIYYSKAENSDVFSLYEIDIETSSEKLIVSDIENPTLFANSNSVFYIRASQLFSYNTGKEENISCIGENEVIAGVNNNIAVTYEPFLFFYILRTYDLKNLKIKSICLSSQNIDKCAIAENDRYMIYNSLDAETQKPLPAAVIDLYTGAKKKCLFFESDSENILGFYCFKTN